MRKRTLRTSLNTRLLLVIAAALLPVLVFQVLTESGARRDREERVAEEALRFVRFVASEQRQIIEGARQVLVTLAEAPAIWRGEVDRCAVFLARTLRSAPRYGSFLTVGRDGRAICAGNSEDRAITLSDRPYVRQAIDEGHFVVGGYITGRGSGRPRLAFATPVRDDTGQVTGAVVGTLDLAWMQAHVDALPLPPGATATITDRDGTILARRPDAPRFVGTLASPDVIREMARAGPGVVTMASLEGGSRIFGFAPIGFGGPDLGVSVSLDRAGMFTAIQAANQRGSLFIALGAMLALLSAALMARVVIHRPIGRLLAAASRWQEGDLAARTGLAAGASEFVSLGRTLDAMAAASEARERELRLAGQAARRSALLLAASEAQVRSVLESSTDCIELLDAAGRVLAVNGPGLQAQGQDDVAALQGRDWASLWPDEARPSVEAALRMTQAGGTARFSHARTTATGTSICWDVVLSPVRTAEGAVERLVATSRDVTEQRRHEARLQEVIEAIPGLVFVTDAAGGHIYTNRHFQDFTGLPATALLGEGWTRTVHPDDLAMVRRRWNESVRLVIPYEVEMRMRGADGTWTWYLVRGCPVHRADGQVDRWYGICLDISDIVAAREARARHERTLERQVQEGNAALRESETWFRLLVQGVTDYAIFMLDPQGRVANWNTGAERIQGYTADEVVGRDFAIFHTEEDRAAGEPARALQTAATEGRYEDEGWRVRKDGTRFWANVILDPIRDEDGVLIGYAEITRDITAQRDSRAALEDAQRRFAQAQKMEAVGQLTGGIAHDFNNLLQVVSGNLELLLARSRRAEDPRSERLLTRSLRAIGRGARLTGQLLSFSRRQMLYPERVRLDRLVGEIHELVRRAVGESIGVTIHADPELWDCILDPGQFEAALLNLVLNARDAMPAGGRIEIALTNLPLAGTEAMTFEVADGNYVRVEVTDTGTGMSPEVLARAFEPFFTTKQIGEGSGLGLPQVHGFVRQSGGGVLARSRADEGTVISLVFPADDQTAAQAPATAAPARDGTPPLSVLLVEDDPDVLGVVRMMLLDAGCSVTTAADGVAALDVLRSDRPIDVLLSDVVMPNGVSGVDLAREARAIRPDIRVLLASGYARDVLNRLGAEDEFTIIAKPYTQASLLHHLAFPGEPVRAG
ncbi:Histidine kinase [Rhodovastum atsumiense]|uniref:histidine kinase n=1 Tax=Rhodovastum atsumiense TaxID=504468 RepID=A0A5M6IPA9_9PROT|nr:PAS domain S-box protein [Rhodovastum atsumiense]KAA5610114.1 PAS domain S-box protein [Rhodovastum atsumiense]CAH2601413.1 Histidine kinase [Rhodovastum atsumiense]